VDIKEKISNLPTAPGVYLMKDSLGSIIYVGKSKNLRSRVGSYFANSKSHSPKVLKLVKNLKDFDYVLTDTEFEALMLENKLIKEIKPAYNRQMKSPKGYCYVCISMDEKYPGIEICMEPVSKLGKQYFGPYTSRNTVEKALCGIKEHCKILCNYGSVKSQGCLKYSMGICLGMCTSAPSREQYLSLLDKVSGLLKGTDLTLLEEMKQEMNIRAENFDFEKAAKYRDYIRAAGHLTNTAKTLDFAQTDRNYTVAEYLNDDEIKVFLVRYNRLLFSGKYSLSDMSSEKIRDEIQSNILSCFGEALKCPGRIGKDEIDEAHIIYHYLKSAEKTCRFAPIEDQWVIDADSLKIRSAVDELIF
jgi:excinuclease ABC subunit C